MRRGKAMLGGAVALLLAAWAPAAQADWSGDAKGDLLAIGSDGALLLYRGDGTGRVVQVPGQKIGSGWGEFTALLATKFSGDGRPDLLVRRSDGALLMYRGNGSGGFVTGTGEGVGTGWQDFTALLAPGDFSGDGKPDILARTSDGALLLYRGTGDSGFAGGAVTIGAAGRASRRCWRRAISAATASPTCSPGSPTARSSCIAVTVRAAG